MSSEFAGVNDRITIGKMTLTQLIWQIVMFAPLRRTESTAKRKVNVWAATTFCLNVIRNCLERKKVVLDSSASVPNNL
jgi:hypothetical protein